MTSDNTDGTEVLITWWGMARGLLVLLVLAAAIAHVTGHLVWFWTGDPGAIIGGNGLQVGDLHLFIH